MDTKGNILMRCNEKIVRLYEQKILNVLSFALYPHMVVKKENVNFDRIIRTSHPNWKSDTDQRSILFSALETDLNFATSIGCDIYVGGASRNIKVDVFMIKNRCFDDILIIVLDYELS
jgi:hypothetical protein